MTEQNDNRLSALTRLQRFNVLILYDVAASATSAVCTYHRLKRGLESAYEFRLKLWRFDMLESADRAPGAASDLADADMVIVAWSSHRTGLSSLRAWADQWPDTSHGERRALVSLYTGPHGDADQVPAALEHNFLSALAERAGMDLIQSATAPAEEAVAAAHLDDELAAVPILVSEPGRYPQQWRFASASPSRHVSPRWGINE
jgi:hypothetical protein